MIDDANVDAPVMPLCEPPLTILQETMVTFGVSFTARLGSNPYAIKFLYEDNGGGVTVGAIRGTSSSPTSIYSLLFSDDTTYRYRSPHLSPDGLELYMRLESTAVQSETWLAVSSRTQGSDAWSNVRVLALVGAPPTGSLDDPSSPTTTNPRRMVVSHGTTGFSELQQIDDTTWQLIREQAQVSYVTTAATMVTFLGEAHLTEDGRRLVFRGQVPSALISAWYLERATLDEPFVGPARQLPTMSSVQYPFFTSDCMHLFYARNGDNFTYDVAYP